VIAVWMSHDDRIEAPNSFGEEGWEEDTASQVACPPASSIDQHGVRAVPEQNRIPLPHVQHRQLDAAVPRHVAGKQQGQAGQAWKLEPEAGEEEQRQKKRQQPGG
jgi:hypothetical protein